MFVGVGNGLLAALPHARPRLKILMATHWCCRVTPGQGTWGVGIPVKLLFLRSLAKSGGGLGAIRNEDLGPKRRLAPRSAYHRGLRLGHDPVMVISIVSPFTPRVVGIRGKLLFSRSRGANEIVGNGLPKALPHASPRLKILMAPNWCCRFTPGQGSRGRYPGKTLVLEIPLVKVQEGLGAVRTGLKFETKIGPRGAYPRGLILGRDPIMVIGFVSPFTLGWSVSGENSCSRDLGG